MRTSKFKPIMISFDEKSYNVAKDLASEKLELLDQASVWINNVLDPSKIDMKKLSNNMVSYFKDLILLTFMEQNTLGLSADKLIEAKEIPLAELQHIQKQYENIRAEVFFNKNEAFTKVERKDFEKYTSNEIQNKKLLTGNKLISALKDIEKETTISKMFVSRLTNGYVLFDVYQNGYIVNPEVLKI